MLKMAPSSIFGVKNWNFIEYRKVLCFELIEVIFFYFVYFLCTWLCLGYIMFDLLDCDIESVVAAKVSKIFKLSQKSVTFLKRSTGYVFDSILTQLCPHYF